MLLPLPTLRINLTTKFMREILFRGKRVDNNEWVSGHYLTEVGRGINGCQDTTIYFIKDKFGTQIVYPQTIGQKWIVSQKEFFGGDLFTAICSISGSKQKAERICKVIDSDSGFDVAVWHKGEWWGYSFMDFSTAKIIGNLTDTPELLK